MRLRPLGDDDEEAFVAAHESMAREGFTFGLGYEPGTSWPMYLERLASLRAGRPDADGSVSATFLVADVDGQIVGRASVRHRLNDLLAREGGHVGYGVLAGHRRRGYATEILRQSLTVARAAGVQHVLVTCDDDNIGSARVIGRCGGVFESVLTVEDGHRVRRYWID